MYYEAAIIDGANAWQRFTKITLPMLSSITFMVTMLQMFSAFKVVVSVWVMTMGGPAKSTNVLVFHLVQSAFKYFKMGYASAVSVILFAIILFFTILQMLGEKKIVHYQ